MLTHEKVAWVSLHHAMKSDHYNHLCPLPSPRPEPPTFSKAALLCMVQMAGSAHSMNQAKGLGLSLKQLWLRLQFKIVPYWSRKSNVTVAVANLSPLTQGRL